MEWLILAALIVIGVGSNAEATVPLQPPLPEMERVIEISHRVVETSHRMVEVSPQGHQPIQLQPSTEVATDLQKAFQASFTTVLQTPARIVSLKPQGQQKEIIDKFHDSHRGLISNSEFHKMTIQEPQFVLLGPVFEEFVEAARQIKPSHLVLALRYIRNSQMSTEEIIEMIINWPPKRLEHRLSKEMRGEFDLLVKALQKLPKEYLLKGVCFIRSSKETSGQLASLITTDL